MHRLQNIQLTSSMEGSTRHYSSFTFQFYLSYRPPDITFNPDVAAFTSRISSLRPMRPNQSTICYAMDALRDVSRLSFETNPVILIAKNEAMHLADLFVNHWFSTPGLLAQMPNTHTNGSAHVRMFYVVVLSRHALEGTIIRYYDADILKVYIEEVTGQEHELPWSDIPQWCSDHLWSRRYANVSSTSVSSLHCGTSDNDGEIEERQGQAQDKAEGVQAFGDVDLDLPIDPRLARSRICEWNIPQ